MKKTDDIDLFLTLHEHGWSTCWIYANNKTIELTISHVFGDPYVDFITSLNQLIDKHNETSFIWYGEPGGEKIEIKRIRDRQHMLTVKVDGFCESFGDPIKNYETTITFEIKEKQLITIAYFQLKKIEALLKEKSFAVDRKSDFPFEHFLKFENKVKNYLS